MSQDSEEMNPTSCVWERNSCDEFEDSSFFTTCIISIADFLIVP